MVTYLPLRLNSSGLYAGKDTLGKLCVAIAAEPLLVPFAE
jgi:hypothetical protein